MRRRSWTVSPADRLAADVAWLAADEREGRGLGTDGLHVRPEEWLARRFEDLGLEPAGENGTYFQTFDAPIAVEVEAAKP